MLPAIKLVLLLPNFRKIILSYLGSQQTANWGRLELDEGLNSLAEASPNLKRSDVGSNLICMGEPRGLLL